MSEESKVIRKGDDSSKNFIIEMLNGNETHGFDVDSIYNCQGRWVVIEFLKCDSEYVTPHTSHPNKYPWNWRKFVSLFKLSQKLEGDLFLVNYSDKDCDKDEVRIMKVSGIDYEALDKYVKSRIVRTNSNYVIIEPQDDLKINREEFQKWFLDLNSKSRG